MVLPPLSWLLCVELRADRTTPGSLSYAPAAQMVVPRLGLLLKHARASNWAIVHVHGRQSQGPRGPIRGLEPRTDEPVYYAETPSAFSVPPLRKSILENVHGGIVHVAGFGLGEIILPSVVMGRELGLRMVVVEDAIAATPIGKWSGDEILGVVTTLLTPLASLTCAEAVATGASSKVVMLRKFSS